MICCELLSPLEDALCIAEWIWNVLSASGCKDHCETGCVGPWSDGGKRSQLLLQLDQEPAQFTGISTRPQLQTYPVMCVFNSILLLDVTNIRLLQRSRSYMNSSCIVSGTLFISHSLFIIRVFVIIWSWRFVVVMRTNPVNWNSLF